MRVTSRNGTGMFTDSDDRGQHLGAHHIIFFRVTYSCCLLLDLEEALGKECSWWLVKILIERHIVVCIHLVLPVLIFLLIILFNHGTEFDTRTLRITTLHRAL